MDFTLIKELPASHTQQTYQFSDYLIVPGQNYQYIVEVLDQNGNTAFSQAVISQSMISLVAQAAILLTSFMLVFGLITVSEGNKPNRSSYFFAKTF